MLYFNTVSEAVNGDSRTCSSENLIICRKSTCVEELSEYKLELFLVA